MPESGSNTWIIVPAYNEGGRLALTLESLCKRHANVVVVDDGSVDDTYDVARSQPAWVLHHVVNCGQGAALKTGIDFALAHGAEYLVTFDADGQHSVEDIEALLEPIRSDRADVVLGSRFRGKAVGMPLARRLLLKLAVLFTWAFSQIAVTDTHNGLRAFSRQAALKIRITQNRMAHASQILDEIRRHRLKFCEVPVTVRYTVQSLEKGQRGSNALKIVGQLILGRLIR